MPLINGQKMACEPCIRGHRSTKCTHANERLMVPVRKPGRPLSSCPHPASRPCTCAAVTAAIPKKQKCRCGTSEQAPGPKTDQETSNGLVTPPSPSPKMTATTPTYRVQKASSKNGSGRKHIDPAGLERMDASQLNILSSPELRSPRSPPNGSMPPLPAAALPGYGMMGFLPNGTSFGPGPAMFPLYQQLASPNPMVDRAASNVAPPPNGHHHHHHHPPHMGEQIAPSSARSCCSSGKPTFARGDWQQAPRANGAPDAEGQPKSCCSSTAEKLETRPHERLPASEMGPQVNGVMMPHFNAPVGMPNGGVYPFFAQPTIFAYPPQYGSYLQPLQPDQWRQLMTTLNFGQPVPNIQNMPYNAPNPVQFQQCNAGLDAADSWTSHQCGCGDSCQCIGCATHPYNQATQDYVRSAWNSMLEEDPKRHRHSDSAHSIPSSNHETPAPPSRSPNGGSTTPTVTKGEGTVSPTMAQTPSDANSTVGEELTLSASDFFFVSYPFGDTCEGEMVSCPCGDDCQCIGCAIHNGSATADQRSVESR
ncbi:copper-sensing transcription factor [Trichoderma cornu-damae]|uniref:Copper-sensing transcription factor n=1 Tax=Trichoderma cornu-damae TaxID=654480 RepID=A0A9P8TVX8_9HYPO|nr:copper-sensing transcription factor [Trichoderma cornu-damae]